jgi:hypothetical protein
MVRQDTPALRHIRFPAQMKTHQRSFRTLNANRQIRSMRLGFDCNTFGRPSLTDARERDTLIFQENRCEIWWTQ